MLDPIRPSDQAEARHAMGRQIHVDLERTIPAPPARVHAALADYRGRERLLPAAYLDYRVEEGGQGGGTVVSYRLRAGRRERPYRMDVSEPTPGVTLVERDRDSSLITTWILSRRPAAPPPTSGCRPSGRATAGSAGSSSAPSPPAACAASTASSSTT
jgi:Polyketide cyclase / dehydrase and lipid transport